MIAFVAVTTGTWEKEGARLPVVTWKVVNDGKVIGEAEAWCDLKQVGDGRALLTLGFVPTIAVELGPEDLASIGFRSGMTLKGDRP